MLSLPTERVPCIGSRHEEPPVLAALAFLGESDRLAKGLRAQGPQFHQEAHDVGHQEPIRSPHAAAGDLPALGWLAGGTLHQRPSQIQLPRSVLAWASSGRSPRFPNLWRQRDWVRPRNDVRRDLSTNTGKPTAMGGGSLALSGCSPAALHDQHPIPQHEVDLDLRT